MAIEEQPTKIKFTYKPGMPNYHIVDVRYEIIEKVPVILFRDKDSESDWEACPLAFFTEVVDFLTAKGVIEKKEEVEKSNDNTILSFPEITPSQETANQNPVSSFSVSSALPILENENNQSGEENIENPEAIIIKEGDIDLGDIPKRTVIRTRVIDADRDPLAAEREGQMLRGDQSAHQIKSQHR